MPLDPEIVRQTRPGEGGEGRGGGPSLGPVFHILATRMSYEGPDNL